MAEPKDDGRAEPKDDGRAEPKDDGRSGARFRGGPSSDAFGGGTGFVVVAFISPVGLNVPDLAVRMLQGSSSMAPPRAKGIGRAAAIAQEEARKRARDQKRIQQQAERWTSERRVKK